MSALVVTMVQAFIIGLGFGIGYFFNKSDLKFWRVLVGLSVGFAVSWLAGIIIWIFVILSNDPNADIPMVTTDGISNTFLFAIIGVSGGVYYGRRKAKLQGSNLT